MKTSQILAFLWLGVYGHIVIYMKQRLFQGEQLDKTPLAYLTNIGFVLTAATLLSISVTSWFIDGFLRQRFKLSEMTAYATMIKSPVSILAKLFILWLSERTLSDKINWNSLLIWLIGSIIAIWGSRGLLNT